MRKKEPWSSEDRWRQPWNGEAVGTLEPGAQAKARRAEAASTSSAAEGGALRPQERALLAQALKGLTPRERDVVEAVWAGGTNDMVAERMCVAPPTLRTHLMRIHRKLGTRDKGEIIRFVAQRLLEGYRSGALAAEGA